MAVRSITIGGICDYDPTGICAAVESAGASAADLLGDLYADNHAAGRVGLLRQVTELTTAIARDKPTRLIFETVLRVMSVGLAGPILDVTNAVQAVIDRIPIPPDILAMTKGSTLLSFYSSGPGSWVRPWIDPYVDGIKNRFRKLGANNLGLEIITQAGTLNATSTGLGMLIDTAKGGMGWPAFNAAINNPAVRMYESATRFSNDQTTIDAYDNFQKGLNASPLMALDPKPLAAALGLSRIDCALETKAILSGRPSDLKAWRSFIQTDYWYGGVHYFYDATTGAIREERPPKPTTSKTVVQTLPDIFRSKEGHNPGDPYKRGYDQASAIEERRHTKQGDLALALLVASAGGALYWWHKRQKQQTRSNPRRFARRPRYV